MINGFPVDFTITFIALVAIYVAYWRLLTGPRGPKGA